MLTLRAITRSAIPGIADRQPDEKGKDNERFQQFYAEITGSEVLKKAFAEAAGDGKVLEFLKANGCEATEEEIRSFLTSKADQQLSDAEMDNAAGGYSRDTKDALSSIFTVGIGCAAGAIVSASTGYAGKRFKDDSRICNFETVPNN